MKILIVSQYFWPEEFRINDLALDLVERGHKVTVLTGNPNYPKGKFYQGYGFKFTTEIYSGIKIHRVPITPRGNSSGIKLLINYLSFVISGSLFACFHTQHYDKIFAVNYSPITALYPAIVYKKLKKIPLLIWVQDIWPESITAAGKMQFSFAMTILNKLVRNIYRNSDKILVQSEAFIPSIEEKGATKKQIEYIPNWAEDLYCDEKIFVEKFQNLIPSGFKIMFAGNIGEAQDFESILKAAEATKQYPEIKWLIVGDGRKKAWVETEIVRLELQKSVYLFGRYPLDDMPNLFVHADIMLVSLKDEKIFSLTIPSKIQSYMAFGKPIACMLNGIGAEVIQEAKCGYVAKAMDYNSLAKNVIDAYKQDINSLMEKGLSGKKYYQQNFSKKMIIDRLIQLFSE